MSELISYYSSSDSPEFESEENRKYEIQNLVAEIQKNMGEDDEAGQLKAGQDMRELVALTHKDIYTLARRLTGNDEDAEDVVQNTYLRAWKGLPKFRGDSQFTTWIHRITVNAAITHMNKRKRNQHEDIDDVPVARLAVSSGAEDSVENSELKHRLSLALTNLPNKLRETVVLRDIYDQPHETIARELGISENASKVRLHRARAMLRKALSPEATGED